LGHFGYQTIFDAKKGGNEGKAQEIYHTLMVEANNSIKRENKALAKIHKNKTKEFNYEEVKKKMKERLNNRKKYYTIAVEILEQKKFNANGDKKTYETTRVYEDVIRAKNKKDVKKLIKMQIDEFYPYDDSNCVVSCV